MQTYILKENVLSDDELLLPEKGKIFKGGYIAILKIHTYLNAWNDKQTIKRFRSETELQKYLDKYYPNLEHY
jgi:hypothetical protein